MSVFTQRSTPARLMGVVLGVVCIGALSSAPASAVVSTQPQQTEGTNARVSEILAGGGGTVYVAGSFTAVTDNAGNQVAPISYIAKFSGQQFERSWNINANGAVTAMALSGGTLYIGGDFTRIDGAPRAHLAAVDAGTGTLTNWDPSATGGSVRALAVSGGKVYVGGNYTSLSGGQSFLGRVNVSDGALDQNWTPRVDARVRSLALSSDGSKVYAGGDFTTINGSTAGKSIASLSTGTSATLTSGFNAGATNEGAESPAIDLFLSGTHLLAAVAGSGGGCASLDAATGKTLWSKHANGNMQAVTAMGSTVYCGGHFGGLGSFGGQTRFKLAAVDENSGTILSFAPRINSPLGVWALDRDATHLYVGGDFTKITRKLQSHFAVFQ